MRRTYHPYPPNLVERDPSYLGWVGQFPTKDCSGPVDKRSRYEYNLNDDCKKVDWELDAIGVNFGSGTSSYGKLMLYTDSDCKKPAQWFVESLGKSLAREDKQCFSQGDYGGPYHSMKMEGGKKNYVN